MATRFISRTIGTRAYVVSSVSALCVSCTGIAYYTLHQRQLQEQHRKEQAEIQLKAQAAALSKDLILGVLKTDQSLKLVTELLLRACKDPEFTAELVAFLKYVFIENERGHKALMKFLVDDVVMDPWVNDNLLMLVKVLGDDILNDKNVWPGYDTGTLGMLKDTSLDALASDRFNDELWDSVAKSLWGTFFSVRSSPATL